MDFKDRMIEAVERGWTDERNAYEYVRESMADGADRARKRAKENPPDPCDCDICSSGGTCGGGVMTEIDVEEHLR